MCSGGIDYSAVVASVHSMTCTDVNAFLHFGRGYRSFGIRGLLREASQAILELTGLTAGMPLIIVDAFDLGPPMLLKLLYSRLQFPLPWCERLQVLSLCGRV